MKIYDAETEREVGSVGYIASSELGGGGTFSVHTQDGDYTWRYVCVDIDGGEWVRRELMVYDLGLGEDPS